MNSKTDSAISIKLSRILEKFQHELLVMLIEQPIFMAYDNAIIVDAVVVVLQIRDTRIGKVVPAGIPVNKTVPESCMVTFMLPVVPIYTARVTVTRSVESLGVIRTAFVAGSPVRLF
jgi:hypothetical protein